jgi:homoserine O-succinyltransferase
LRQDRPLPDYLEAEIEPELDNTWGDTARAIVNNWLGLVYQVTDLDRRGQYMDEIDPSDPLGLRK